MTAVFPSFWKWIHIAAIGFLVVAKIATAEETEEEDYAFGFGIGLNPPLDIHIPACPEDWKHLLDPDHESSSDEPQPVLVINAE